jgi:hypothetical protein
VLSNLIAPEQNTGYVMHAMSKMDPAVLLSLLKQAAAKHAPIMGKTVHSPEISAVLGIAPPRLAMQNCRPLDVLAIHARAVAWNGQGLEHAKNEKAHGGIILRTKNMIDWLKEPGARLSTEDVQELTNWLGECCEVSTASTCTEWSLDSAVVDYHVYVVQQPSMCPLHKGYGYKAYSCHIQSYQL